MTAINAQGGEAAIERWATISDCGQYRYVLGRRWSAGPRATWVMLNPSTADGQLDDPTIRRCIGFSKREGCGGMFVVNLFAHRSTDPDALLTAVDPIGPDNPNHQATCIDTTGPVIAAWGSWLDGLSTPQAASIERGDHGLYAMADWLGVTLMCLGRTKSGAPRHPLYVKGDAPLIEFRAPIGNGSRERPADPSLNGGSEVPR